MYTYILKTTSWGSQLPKASQYKPYCPGVPIVISSLETPLAPDFLFVFAIFLSSLQTLLYLGLKSLSSGPPTVSGPSLRVCMWSPFPYS